VDPADEESADQDRDHDRHDQEHDGSNQGARTSTTPVTEAARKGHPGSNPTEASLGPGQRPHLSKNLRNMRDDRVGIVNLVTQPLHDQLGGYAAHVGPSRANTRTVPHTRSGWRAGTQERHRS
jgi:hypothetical protein